MYIDTHTHYAESLNNSLCLPQVADCIAQLKGISLAEVRDATAENAMRLFRFSEIPIDKHSGMC